MAAGSRFCCSKFVQNNILKRTRNTHLSRLNIIGSRSELLSCNTARCFSSSKIQQRKSNDPYLFSKSRARHHKIDDTLGITKEKSNVPIFIGLGLFTAILYVGFLRKEDKVVMENLEQTLERMRLQHEEKQKKHDNDSD